MKQTKRNDNFRNDIHGASAANGAPAANDAPAANGAPAANDAPTANDAPAANDAPTTNGAPPSIELTPLSTPKRAMSTTKKTVVAAILAALGTVMLLVGSVFSVLDLSLVSLAAFTVVIAVIELQGAFPWLIWGVTGTLALILCPDKTAAVEYILFGGLYPICKAAFERLHPILAWTVKFSYFNTVLIAFVIISRYVLHVPAESTPMLIALAAGANLYFYLFDLFLSGAVHIYLVKIRRKLRLGDYF